jgi:bromodomain adjacent to zinc finger domain protein 1A
MLWLNVKGNRELKLKESLTKWADHISSGMRKRSAVSLLELDHEAKD